MAASARHETRAPLRAHVSAASSCRHSTRHCPVCHRLLRLAVGLRPTGRSGPAAARGAGREPGTRVTAAGRQRPPGSGVVECEPPLAHVCQEQQGLWHVTGVTA
ncbi:DUF6274 family protein [Streptomyces sp. NPDC051207]|uniref:DUF6274 family protein n=1 Tax=Streptomyces sp. NPDC051207 TaxID=3154641 RepID=UPI00343F80A1